jgi:hypothetical protein
MNRNRLKILLALGAALALSGCGDAATQKAGDVRAPAAPSVNAASPAPPSDVAAGVATANVSAAAPTPSAAAGAAGAARQDASRSAGSRAPGNAPRAAMPTTQIGSGGNDFFLFTQARAAVNADPELKAANLVLDVKEGVVTLSGTVASAAQKSKAEQLAREAGAKNVRNQLRVSAGN